MKNYGNILLLLCMLIGMCAGCSERTEVNQSAALSAEPMATVTLTPTVSAATEQTASETTSPTVEEQVDSTTAKKETKESKYAHWEYDEKTHCLTISGKGETHDDAYARDGQGEFFFNNFDNLSDNPDFSGKGKEVKEIIIEQGVTAVNTAAFNRFTNLEKVAISDSVEIIGDYAFYECESLKEIIIPNRVTSIGKKCFFGCKSLEKITFGKKVKKIGEGTFAGCESLRQITVSKGNKNLSVKKGILYHNKKKILYFAFGNAKKVTIPKGTTKIADCAFYMNPNLQTVEIPASVAVIEGGAFYQCKNLQKVTFAKQSTCKTIKDFVWDWDSGNYEATFYGCFEKCETLKELIFSENLKYIGEYCFRDCASLEKLYFGRNFKGTKIYYNDDEGRSSHSKQSEFVGLPFVESLCVLKEITVSKSNKYFCSIDGVMYDKNKEILYVYPRNKTD